MQGANAASVRALADTGADTGADTRAAAARAARWGDLRKRTLSAVVLGPAALACIWFGSEAWMALMALAAVGLGVEWAGLCGRKVLGWPGLAVPCALVLSGVAAALGLWQAAVGLLVLGSFLVLQTGHSRALAAGVPYVGLPLMALMWLRDRGDAGRADVLFLIAVVWASDIGAYLAGRLLGGPKLAPSISPGKTWSGAVGGLLVAMAVGEAVAQSMAPAPYGRAAAAAAVLGVVSAGGDLFESWVKRRFGVKDSGRLIPGHGGLLDRLDGLLAAAPAALVLAALVGRGGVLWK